jgi:hypothetical protein
LNHPSAYRGRGFFGKEFDIEIDGRRVLIYTGENTHKGEINGKCGKANKTI